MIRNLNELKAWWCVTLPQWIAWKLPRRVVYFAYIRLHAAATTGRFSNRTPDEVTWSEAVKAWEANSVEPIAPTVPSGS